MSVRPRSTEANPAARRPTPAASANPQTARFEPRPRERREPREARRQDETGRQRQGGIERDERRAGADHDARSVGSGDENEKAAGRENCTEAGRSAFDEDVAPRDPRARQPRGIPMMAAVRRAIRSAAPSRPLQRARPETGRAKSNPMRRLAIEGASIDTPRPTASASTNTTPSPNAIQERNSATLPPVQTRTKVRREGSGSRTRPRRTRTFFREPRGEPRR